MHDFTNGGDGVARVEVVPALDALPADELLASSMDSDDRMRTANNVFARVSTTGTPAGSRRSRCVADAGQSDAGTGEPRPVWWISRADGRIRPRAFALRAAAPRGPLAPRVLGDDGRGSSSSAASPRRTGDRTAATVPIDSPKEP